MQNLNLHFQTFSKFRALEMLALLPQIPRKLKSKIFGITFQSFGNQYQESIFAINSCHRFPSNRPNFVGLKSIFWKTEICFFARTTGPYFDSTQYLKLKVHTHSHSCLTSRSTHTHTICSHTHMSALQQQKFVVFSVHHQQQPKSNSNNLCQGSYTRRARNSFVETKRKFVKKPTAEDQLGRGVGSLSHRQQEQRLSFSWSKNICMQGRV